MSPRYSSLVWRAAILCGSLLAASCAAPSRPSQQDDARQPPNAGVHRGQEVSLRSRPPSDRGDEPGVRPVAFLETGDAALPPAPVPDDLPKAAAAQEMTVEQAMQYALDHHPLLQARHHEVEAARARLVTAGLLPNPQLVMDTQSPIEDPDPTQLTTRVTFTIPTGGKRRLRKAAAEAGIQRTRYALARETEAVLAEAADAAIEVLYLQGLIELEAQLSGLATQAVEIDRGRFKAGVLPYSSVVRLELDAANLELARLEAVGRLELARIRLTRAVGRAPSHPIAMVGGLEVRTVPPVELGRLLAEAEKSRPELAESRTAAWEAERLLALARAEARPDITLGPRFRDVLRATGDELGARFAVDLPLFDRNQGGIAESAATLRTRCALVDVAELNTLGDVAAAYLELSAIQGRLEYYQRHVAPVLEQTEATIRDASVEKVLDPGRTADLLQRLVKMRLEHLDLRYFHARLRTRLEILLGRPLEELQGPAGPDRR